MPAIRQTPWSLISKPSGHCLPRGRLGLIVRARHKSSLSEFEIKQLLSTPTWSVKSLLSSASQYQATDAVSSNQLHHLLRLSALPPPSSREEEAKMLRTLNAQLHFVREMQKVDTAGVEPLCSLRDETAQAQKENEIGLDDLKEAFGQEEIKGKHHKRIRRRPGIEVDTKGAEDWDVLGHAERKVGNFFVVESTRDVQSS